LGKKREMKALMKVTDICNVVEFAVATDWGRRREMERMKENY
jgi:hypothetical protein